jgi:hypothetical protein
MITATGHPRSAAIENAKGGAAINPLRAMRSSTSKVTGSDASAAMTTLSAPIAARRKKNG